MWTAEQLRTVPTLPSTCRIAMTSRDKRLASNTCRAIGHTTAIPYLHCCGAATSECQYIRCPNRYPDSTVHVTLQFMTAVSLFVGPILSSKMTVGHCFSDNSLRLFRVKLLEVSIHFHLSIYMEKCARSILEHVRCILLHESCVFAIGFCVLLLSYDSVLLLRVCTTGCLRLCCTWTVLTLL